MVTVVALAASPVSASRCGSEPGDAAAVAAVTADAAAQCGCCSPLRRGQRMGCARSIAKAAVEAGTLRRQCVRAVRAAARQCPVGPRDTACATSGGCFDPIARACTGEPCSPAQPCPAFNVYCAPECGQSPPPCRTDDDCDDGNPCSADTCVEDACEHLCLCVGPGGAFSCCPGPAAACGFSPHAGRRWYHTCGDPVCRIPDRPAGVPPCTDKRFGKPCSVRGERCDDGSGCGVLLICSDRDPSQGLCPISLRRFKDGIRYLDDADRQRLRDTLLAMPLATYRYHGDDANRHLGFLIEDVGPGLAVAPDGAHVDLYGYTSMAVAAIQAQARQIDALKREVAALRAALDERRR